MSLMLTAFRLNLKRIVTSRSFILIMLLLPLAVYGCASFLQSDASILRIKVGVIYDRRDELSQNLLNAVLENEEISLEYFENDEAGRAEMESMIKTGELECGYIIHSDIAEQVKAGKLTELITLVKSPQTVADAAVNEMFCAAFLKAGMANITTAEILKVFKQLDYDETKEIITEKIAEYEDMDIFVKGDYSYRDGVYTEQTEQASPFSKRLLHGIIALFLLTATMFMLPRFIDEKQRSFSKRLGFTGACKYYFSLLLSLFSADFIFGLISIFLIRLFYPQALSGIVTEITLLSLYIAAVCAAGVFIICLLDNSDWIYAASIFILIIVIALGGIIFDIGEIVPLLSRPADHIATSGYINYIIYGDIKYLYILPVTFSVSLAGALTAVFFRRNRA